MMFYTYLHCKPDGTPFYVGKGSKSRVFELRGRNRVYKRTVKKYGLDRIRIVIFEQPSEQEAFDCERKLIAKFKQAGISLANFNDGGTGCLNPALEIRAKMSASHKGKKLVPLTVEHRNKISAALMGHSTSDEAKAKIGAGNRGKVMSEEAKKKISEAGKGRVFSAETRAKIGAKHKGKKISAAQIEAHRLALTGRKLSKEHIEKLRGQIVSEETRQKLRLALTGRPVSVQTREKIRASVKATWYQSRGLTSPNMQCSVAAVLQDQFDP